MAIIYEKDVVQDSLIDVAQKMVVAGLTAPKARGANHIVTAILTGQDIQEVARETRDIGQREDNAIFLRDAENIRQAADVLILIGCKIKSLNLTLCGYCGFQDCKHKNEHPDVPCAFNTGDLGIAIGSMVSVAMDHRVDNRIMYTVGIAARNLHILGEDVPVVYGIPLSASAKNPFFDRK